MQTPEFIESLPVANILGEGVLWHPDQKAVWWTDIEARELYRYCPETRDLDIWPTPARLTAFAFIEHSDRLMVSFDRGFAFFTPETGAIEWLSQPECHLPTHRFNDGKVDPRGRFWAGTMVSPDSRLEERAGLYCWEGKAEHCSRLSDLLITNGLSWSPDGTVMYVSDSGRGRYYAYDFDLDTGRITNEREFARTPEGVGPDGSCIDAAGNVWNAQYGGGQVVCYSPSGQILQRLDVPVSQPTCVAFGGPGYQWLFITTAREHLTEEQLIAQPEAGNMLIYRTDAEGLPTPYCRV